MAATIVARTQTGFTVQVEIPYKDSMLDAEDAIQQALNQGW
jgi:phosphoribosylformylglycinamidine (FGAM) synthase PurS component